MTMEIATLGMSANSSFELAYAPTFQPLESFEFVPHLMRVKLSGRNCERYLGNIFFNFGGAEIERTADRAFMHITGYVNTAKKVFACSVRLFFQISSFVYAQIRQVAGFQISDFIQALDFRSFASLKNTP